MTVRSGECDNGGLEEIGNVRCGPGIHGPHGPVRPPRPAVRAVRRSLVWLLHLKTNGSATGIRLKNN